MATIISKLPCAVTSDYWCHMYNQSCVDRENLKENVDDFINCAYVYQMQMKLQIQVTKMYHNINRIYYNSWFLNIIITSQYTWKHNNLTHLSLESLHEMATLVRQYFETNFVFWFSPVDKKLDILKDEQMYSHDNIHLLNFQVRHLLISRNCDSWLYTPWLR